jgi:hypothetical protein
MNVTKQEIALFVIAISFVAYLLWGANWLS